MKTGSDGERRRGTQHCCKTWTKAAVTGGAATRTVCLNVRGVAAAGRLPSSICLGAVGQRARELLTDHGLVFSKPECLMAVAATGRAYKSLPSRSGAERSPHCRATSSTMAGKSAAYG